MGRKSKAVYSVKNDLKSKRLSNGKNSFFKQCNQKADNYHIAKRASSLQMIAK